MRLMHKGETGRSATRALLQLLLLVLALTAIEYLFQGSLESSPLKTHPYKLIYNATQPSLRIANKSETWLKPTTKNSTTPFHAKNATMDKTEPTPSLCPKLPPDLGPVQVNKTNLELDFVEKKYPEIKWGGHYAPPNCTARDKVAIIVPYRDRAQHLAIFLNHMHPFLMKQQIEYGIYVIEQDGNKEFNRAKLMNIGFVESQRLDRGWQCFVFHDVDLLPLDTRNLYSCPRQPRHMSANIDAHKHKLKYDEHFGGVSAVTREQFRRVNGFSNRYWGWGSEDDDMFFRLKKLKYHVARYKMSIARYTMLHHKKSVPNPKRIQLFLQAVKTFRNATNGRSQDGLSTLEYTLDRVVQYHLYTYVLANIQEDKNRDTRFGRRYENGMQH